MTEDDVREIYSRIRVNAFGEVLFPFIACFLNHSCYANCNFEGGSLIAVKDILPDEHLLISYVDPGLDSDIKVEILQKIWDINCEDSRGCSCKDIPDELETTTDTRTTTDGKSPTDDVPI